MNKCIYIHRLLISTEIMSQESHKIHTINLNYGKHRKTILKDNLTIYSMHSCIITTYFLTGQLKRQKKDQLFSMTKGDKDEQA